MAASPDGRFIGTSVVGSSSLVVRTIDETAVRQLAGTTGARDPAIPNSRPVAFWRPIR
jgi:hypothetical protein